MTQTIDALSVLKGMERFFVRSRATGHELDFPILQTITVEDERIAEVRPFYWDTAAIAAACTNYHSDDDRLPRS